MSILLKSFIVILLADFVTGFVHWLEDSFWSLDTPILGKWIVAPNLDHHKNGQAFLNKSWLQSSWDLLLVGCFMLFSAYALGRMNWEICLFAIIIINANQIHKWAHITRYENKPRLIGYLQKLYILQRTSHHGQHHRKPNNSHYCTVTNVLNPILDKVGFWRGLEYLVGHKANYSSETGSLSDV